MEQFVDQILRADKKAREIIVDAQKQRDEILKQAALDAAAAIAARNAASAKDIAAIDAATASAQEEKMLQADEDYIRLKHALDAAFEAGRTGWLQELTDAVLDS